MGFLYYVYRRGLTTQKHRDPVCGMRVNEDISFEHNGQTHYFCSKSCKNSFSKDPKHYLQTSQQEKTYNY